ncbi:LacI family DNA-binding transcriptional regulator [Planktotalea sp.]|uniref:LacI family DNA-binding transcriptional regulator n=1 Tax=Planktotalea sp. TaxID=2029877 RepID=UPI003D6A94D6
MNNQPRKKKPNLRDVAREAGVSVATVSRVLNTPDVVNAEKRQIVQAVIERLGFVRSAAARSINSGRTKIFGALVPTLDSDIFALTLDALEKQLAGLGMSLVVATTNDDPELETRKAEELLNIGVEGLFLSGVSHDEELLKLIERTRTPTLAMSYFDPQYRLPTIGYDNALAARQALEHLIELGHRNIAMVHGPTSNNDRTRARVEGTFAQGVDVSYFETELSAEGGSTATRKSLKTGDPYDAYLCASDVLAFGVLSALSREGIKVPNDVSVIGIHDLPSSSVTFPTLSTIRLPVQKMGICAANALFEWAEKDVRPESICLPTELKARESTQRRS